MAFVLFVVYADPYFEYGSTSSVKKFTFIFCRILSLYFPGYTVKRRYRYRCLTVLKLPFVSSHLSVIRLFLGVCCFRTFTPKFTQFAAGKLRRIPATELTDFI